jgi:hypothetical protein
MASRTPWIPLSLSIIKIQACTITEAQKLIQQAESLKTRS